MAERDSCFFMSSLITSQLKCHSHHSRAAAEAVVVGVGVDAVEEGVGVVALVEEVGEFQAEDALLPLVLRGGVEEGHALVCVGSPLLTSPDRGGKLAAHMVIV